MARSISNRLNIRLLCLMVTSVNILLLLARGWCNRLELVANPKQQELVHSLRESDLPLLIMAKEIQRSNNISRLRSLLKTLSQRLFQKKKFQFQPAPSKKLPQSQENNIKQQVVQPSNQLTGRNLESTSIRPQPLVVVMQVSISSNFLPTRTEWVSGFIRRSPQRRIPRAKVSQLEGLIKQLQPCITKMRTCHPSINRGTLSSSSTKEEVSVPKH